MSLLVQPDFSLPGYTWWYKTTSFSDLYHGYRQARLATDCVRLMQVDVYRWRRMNVVMEWMGKHALVIYVLAACNVLPVVLQGFYSGQPQNNIVSLLPLMKWTDTIVSTLLEWLILRCYICLCNWQLRLIGITTWNGVVVEVASWESKCFKGLSFAIYRLDHIASWWLCPLVVDWYFLLKEEGTIKKRGICSVARSSTRSAGP